MIVSRRLDVRVLSMFVLLSLGAGASAHAMGRKPTRQPHEMPPTHHEVPAFAMPEDGQAFPNYRIWKKSRLPRFLQVAHCTGMALFARQIFNWADFDPTRARLTLPEYRKLLHKIYWIPTPTLPGAHPKLVIPGYANWNEMTRDPAIEDAIKDILGNALGDIRRPNWNWSPIDVLRTKLSVRKLIELNVRSMVSQDRVVTLYLTRGTRTAHAVLVYAYEVLGDRVRYTVYDSNHPSGPTYMDFMVGEARFKHPDFGMRDPWILHPYADEFSSTREYIDSIQ